MELLKLLLGISKKGQKTVNQSKKQEQREALILTGKEQFEKLQRLGLRIPIVVL